MTNEHTIHSNRSLHGKAKDNEPPFFLPACPGLYLLILRLDRDLDLTIGALVRCLLRPGFYCYVGSAMGPGGLRARVMRHYRCTDCGTSGKKKRLHWHIDFVLEHAELRATIPLLLPVPENSAENVSTEELIEETV